MTQERDVKTLSDADWRARLDEATYRVLRQQGTEPAFSHPGFPAGPGQFLCAGCGSALFDKADKYDSGSGWPSFTRPNGDVGTTRDTSHGMERVEVHCARCGGHLGHVFPDGPGPEGLRYCVNGAALRFDPAG